MNWNKVFLSPSWTCITPVVFRDTWDFWESRHYWSVRVFYAPYNKLLRCSGNRCEVGFSRDFTQYHRELVVHRNNINLVLNHVIPMWSLTSAFLFSACDLSSPLHPVASLMSCSPPSFSAILFPSRYARINPCLSSLALFSPFSPRPPPQ